MTFINADVKLQAYQKGVKLYELPKQLGISESTFYRLMRLELSAENHKKMLEAINKIATQRQL